MSQNHFFLTFPSHTPRSTKSYMPVVCGLEGLLHRHLEHQSSIKHLSTTAHGKPLTPPGNLVALALDCLFVSGRKDSKMIHRWQTRKPHVVFRMPLLRQPPCPKPSVPRHPRSPRFARTVSTAPSIAVESHKRIDARRATTVSLVSVEGRNRARGKTCACCTGYGQEA